MRKAFEIFSGTVVFVSVTSTMVHTGKTIQIDTERKRILKTKDKLKIEEALRNMDNWNRKSFLDQVFTYPEKFPPKY